MDQSPEFTQMSPKELWDFIFEHRNRSLDDHRYAMQAAEYLNFIAGRRSEKDGTVFEIDSQAMQRLHHDLKKEEAMLIIKARARGTSLVPTDNLDSMR